MNELYRNKFVRVFLFLLIFSIVSIQIIVLGQNQSSSVVIYGGEENNGDGTYTFTYIVTSGSPVITKFRLFSSLFKSGDIELDVTAQNGTSDTSSFEPSWVLYGNEGYLEFLHESDHPYFNDTTIIYKITVDTKSYTGNTIGYIDYQIDNPPGQRIEGKISGPIAILEIIDTNPWYFQLPVILVPVILIIVGIIAYRRNWI